MVSKLQKLFNFSSESIFNIGTILLFFFFDKIPFNSLSSSPQIIVPTEVSTLNKLSDKGTKLRKNFQKCFIPIKTSGTFSDVRILPFSKLAHFIFGIISFLILYAIISSLLPSSRIISNKNFADLILIGSL
ncbi:unnamed protein product [Meloidogyne enterolobii]|uniref:Uncharacterized protein n=1 Tax=Meloidogyne enterolobii TaxID=390850 RepID=A0ACB1AM37_MELEN